MVPTILILSNPYDLCKHNSDKGSIVQQFLNILPSMLIIPIVPITKYITSYSTSYSTTLAKRFYYRHYINYGKTNNRYKHNLMKKKNIPIFKPNV
jgi:hypothetical protein